MFACLPIVVGFPICLSEYRPDCIGTLTGVVAVGPVSDAINGIHAGCSVTDRPVTE